jgi:NIPSNAP
MALYELRTYTPRVGTMAEAVKLYQEIGFPALQKGSHDLKLIGFPGDTGTINQIVHLWKFDDDADRRAHCCKRLVQAKPTQCSQKSSRYSH